MSAFYEFELHGKTCILVPFNRQFLIEHPCSAYMTWFHNPIITRYNSHGLFPYTEKQKEGFLDSLDIATNKIIMAIVYDLIHVGNVSLQSIDWINRSAEIAIILDNNYHGKGIGTEACKKMLEHGFLKMNLNRIWTGTASINLGMRGICKTLGMKEEGCFREAIYLDGEYHDVIEYGILKSEYVE
jgi:RimJ/RimL family protein N-acetyltransferase